MVLPGLGLGHDHDQPTVVRWGRISAGCSPWLVRLRGPQRIHDALVAAVCLRIPLLLRVWPLARSHHDVHGTSAHDGQQGAGVVGHSRLAARGRGLFLHELSCLFPLHSCIDGPAAERKPESLQSCARGRGSNHEAALPRGRIELNLHICNGIILEGKRIVLFCRLLA